MKEIKYTPQGFSYVDVTIDECLKWGGLGICDCCNKGAFKELKLIWILHDTYCEKCFNEWLERAKKYTKKDIEEDLYLQESNHLKWYQWHLDR